MSLGRQIRHWRRSRDLSQKELADEVNVSLDTVRRWEGDLREPRYSDLVNLAKALDITPAELLGEERDEITTTASDTTPSMQNHVAAMSHETGNAITVTIILPFTPDALEVMRKILVLTEQCKNRITTERKRGRDTTQDDTEKPLIQLC